MSAQLVEVVDPVDDQLPGGHPGNPGEDGAGLARVKEHPAHLDRGTGAPEDPDEPGPAVRSDGPRRQVTRAEPDEGVPAAQHRDDDLALPLDHRQAGVEGADLDEQARGGQQATARGVLVADQPRLGRAVRHEHRRHPLLEHRAQRVRQRFGRDDGLGQPPPLARQARVVIPLDERLEIARQPGVPAHPEVGDRGRLEILVADPARQHARADRAGTLVEHRAGR